MPTIFCSVSSSTQAHLLPHALLDGKQMSLAKFLLCLTFHFASIKCFRLSAKPTPAMMSWW